MTYSAQQYRAIELAIVPRAARLPVDIAALQSIATLSFCPVRGAERRVRADHLATLIDATLVEAGR
jgi:hypothetical protein